MNERRDSNDETPQEREERLHDLSRERPQAERTARSDAVEEMRSDRAENLEDIRIERAAQLRVDDALLHAEITRHFGAIDTRMESFDVAVIELKQAVSTRASDKDVVELATDIDNIRKLLIGFIASFAIGSLSIAGGMFYVLAGHIK